MKNRITNFYIWLYSREKYIGPLNGFVFGYAISILQGDDKTESHITSLLCGIIFSFFCSLFLLIANAFNINLSKMKANLSEDDDAEIVLKTWEGINKAGKRKSRIFGVAPKISTPVFILVMTTSLIWGVFSLIMGNIAVANEKSSKELNISEIKKRHESEVLSLAKQLNGESFIKLNDKVKELGVELERLKKQNDSLRKLILVSKTKPLETEKK